MTTDGRRTSALIGLALALLVPMAAAAAGAQAAKGSLVPKAVAFVRTLAQGDFQAAEADFTAQMKEALQPSKLGEVWQRLISQAGPFEDIGDSKTVVQNGYTTVVVRTDFKSRALGLAVTFDSARRIAGVHFVPPP